MSIANRQKIWEMLKSIMGNFWSRPSYHAVKADLVICSSVIGVSGYM